MTLLDALKFLLAKVEAGGHISMDDTDPVASTVIPGCTLGQAGMFHEACQGKSLDAALALHNAVLPGRDWHITSSGTAIIDMPDWTTVVKHKEGHAPARAWLIAILRALIAQEMQHD